MNTKSYEVHLILYDFYYYLVTAIGAEANLFFACVKFKLKTLYVSNCMFHAFQNT